MSDPIWYFADGDEERGPVTEAQIRTLIGTGNLKADDLVWREGMDDWLPAGEVPGLFGGKSPAVAVETPAASGKPKQDKRAASGEVADFRPAERPAGPSIITRWDPRQPLEIFQYLAFLGQPLLLVGLLMVVGSRGCEAIADRYADRLASRTTLAQTRFETDSRQQQARIEQQLSELDDKPLLNAADRSRRDSLNAELQNVSQRRQAEFERLQLGAWKQLEHDAQEARAAAVMWNFWRSYIFWAGTLLLTLALAIVGFTGQGAERWMCLALLAVLLFGLYTFRT